MPTRRTTTTALASAGAGIALAGAVLVGGTPASAASATPTTTPSATSSGSPSGPSSGTAAAKDPAQREAEVVCGRAPKVDARITRALARLHGPATRRGSIARLQKRVDVAKNAGNTAIETYLNDRLTNRQSMVGTLTTRQSDLKGVESWCTANHLGAS
jgi:hypothetical protein